ncbi:type IV pilin protein [Pseudomonas sp. LRF_L74]|uniref:type IV pilin protein n=1 Tax=Pseudomonas sp. LRF_L74 TaxID=3369422 RepID=UPI003F60564A
MDATSTRDQAAFTLIELMVAVAIIAIIAAIALPAYNSYILRGKVKAAQADLVALSLNLENQYQRQLSYPTTSTDNTAATKALFSGWSPAQSKDFDYSLNSHDGFSASGSNYLVAAIGTSNGLSACVLTLENDNTRTAVSCPGVDSTW